MKNLMIKLGKKARGDIHNDFNKCLYCGKCQKCRAKAITVNRKEKEWTWEDEKCVRCGHCVTECPAKSLCFVK